MSVLCVTCGHRVDKVDGDGRCAVCADHYMKRIRYTDNKIRQARSRYQDTRARNDKAHSKHCPHCHRFRYKDQFIKFNDPHGKCEVCRDQEFDAQQRAAHDARRDAKAVKEAAEMIARAKARGII